MKRKDRLMVLVLLFSVVLLSASCVKVYSQTNAFRPKNELIAMFKRLIDAHPAHASYVSVGTTYERQDIWLFRIGNPDGGRVLWDGALHGWEDMGSEVIYLLAEWLLTSNEDTAKEILERNYVLFIPVVNMDSYERQNRNFEDCRYGVDLNRNFVVGWRSKAPNDYDYPGPTAASEPETQVLRSVFQTYRPDFYLNTHYGGGEWLAHYRGSNESLARDVCARIHEISDGRGIQPYPTFSLGSRGFSIGDAAAYGASAWMMELAGGSGCYAHTQHAYHDIVTKFYPKCLAVFIAMCELSRADSDLNKPPTASFTLSPDTNLSIHTPITFQDTSVDHDGKVASWLWDFGDNSSSTETNPTHTYLQPRTYTVTLSVSDEDEANSSVTQTIVITEGCSLFPLQPIYSQTSTSKTLTVDIEDGDFSSIQEAIDYANEGDTIAIQQGTYNENIIIDKQVTLIGEDRDLTCIDGGGTGTVIQVKAHNVQIKDLTIQNGGDESTYGISIEGSHCQILNNRIVTSWVGLYLRNSTHCVLSSNQITFSTEVGMLISKSANITLSLNSIYENDYDGIVVSYSDFNTISNNQIYANVNDGLRFLSSTDNTISDNLLSENYKGISLTDQSSHNVVSYNNISYNEKGIYLRSTDNNIIHHNRFSANQEQAEIRNAPSNTWDAGYPSGGNYWSDYQGLDTNGDGIGDSPYVIDENNEDRYPLTATVIPTIIHDIAVAAIDLSDTEVKVGENTEIVIIIVNEGTVTEVFNLTLSYSDKIIETKADMSLDSGLTKSLNFTWDTTDVELGEYSFKAELTPVPGEIDLEDNLQTQGSVNVVPGQQPLMPSSAVVVAVLILFTVGVVLLLKRRG
jgi:nitrous oxidase accessory protein